MLMRRPYKRAEWKFGEIEKLSDREIQTAFDAICDEQMRRNALKRIAEDAAS